MLRESGGRSTLHEDSSIGERVGVSGERNDKHHDNNRECPVDFRGRSLLLWVFIQRGER
jgi:hypothetical protein